MGGIGALSAVAFIHFGSLMTVFFLSTVLRIVGSVLFRWAATRGFAVKPSIHASL
jgi:hypothetical protein